MTDLLILIGRFVSFVVRLALAMMAGGLLVTVATLAVAAGRFRIARRIAAATTSAVLRIIGFPVRIVAQ